MPGKDDGNNGTGGVLVASNELVVRLDILAAERSKIAKWEQRVGDY